MGVDESIFAKVLEITEPWTVESVALDEKEMEMRIRIGTVKGSMFPCPVCGGMCKVHDRMKREWRTLDMGVSRCFVEADVPRVRCPEHGVRMTEIPWARPFSKYSMHFERLCLSLVREMPVNAAARIAGISGDALWNLLSVYVHKKMYTVNMSRVRMVGVDETSCKRGQDYITLFVDMVSRKILFATPGRGSETMGEFAEWLRAHGGDPDEITDISCDMSAAFLSGSRMFLKNAKPTIDRFHVMKLALEALEETRMSVQKDKRMKLNVRYHLMTNSKNLSDDKMDILDAVLKENAELNYAYGLKEMLSDLYLLETEEYGRMHLDRWIRLASVGAPKSMKRLAKTVKKHNEGILQWFSSKLSNGVLEGINSVIQAVNRMARGYRLARNMISMLYLRGAGILV